MGIAERLKLEGLIGGEQQKDEDASKSEPIQEEYAPKPLNNFVALQNESQVTKDVRMSEKPIITLQSTGIQSLEELDQKIEESFSKDSNGLFACHHCGKSTKQVEQYQGTCRESF